MLSGLLFIQRQWYDMEARVEIRVPMQSSDNIGDLSELTIVSTRQCSRVNDHLFILDVCTANVKCTTLLYAWVYIFFTYGLRGPFF